MARGVFKGSPSAANVARMKAEREKRLAAGKSIGKTDADISEIVAQEQARLETALKARMAGEGVRG